MPPQLRARAQRHPHVSAAARAATMLHRVSDVIAAGPALEPLLARVAAHAVDLVAAEYASVELAEERAGSPALRIGAVHGRTLHEIDHGLPSGADLAERVLHAQRSIRLRPVSNIAEALPAESVQEAGLAVPIRLDAAIIGVLCVRRAARAFAARDRIALEVFAQHIAPAIGNARRFEAERRRASQLATINRIGRLINSSLSLKHVFQTAVEAVSGDLNFAYVAAGLVDPDDPTMLVLYAHTGAHVADVPEGYRQSIDVGIVGEAARDRRPVLVNDVARDPRYLALVAPSTIRAELALPIAVEDRLLGVLNIESERAIGADEVESITHVAAQLAVAIENARHFAEERRRRERLALIARVGQLIAARLDPHELFDTTVEELHRLGYEHVSLFLLDPDDPGWLVKRACASRWLGKTAGYRQRIADGVLGVAARDRRPVVVNDVSGERRYIPVALDATVRAEVALPIVVGDRLLGVLDIEASRRFRAEDVASMQIIVDQLAVAIENAQLFAATQHELHETQRVAETRKRLAVLEERQRLARDLHDSVTQLLFSMTLIAQSIAPAWERDAAEGARRVSRLLELSQAALAEMRMLLAELRPDEPQPEPAVLPTVARMQRDGLAAALRAYSIAIGRDGVRIVLDAQHYQRLAPEAETMLYRVAQEALNNAVKHAQARQIMIRLASTDTTTQLIVKDDGVGFEQASAPAEPRSFSGLGLTTMRERVAALGGTLQFTSAPGAGTTVSVVVPRS